jgi:ABC-type uncharacterized transport system auxiliary subunit
LYNIYIKYLNQTLKLKKMDPNANRMSMGSRAGTSIKPKFGNQPAVSRQGTAIKVNLNLKLGIKSFGWSRCNS